ncbi:uncharacterized protein MYCFIDRAFT_178660 [Pseudocercospora fijiensis CIRAD86]|uniref:Uncharacterized protein n=1 Tax=Pseudocercospora fijiensis (strain CIRAD86) TaxID=383855 RepID=M2YLA6_PSEFD|nr:uncharacterized protein MYCFIDRAFT_178660 [Pseudocercospora fijiensis CIRAD86]EME78525.1 hypothetical protein MYCFIDRAFT_178660 [Pseudocercospora fijiensis CIRAD86]
MLIEVNVCLMAYESSVIAVRTHHNDNENNIEFSHQGQYLPHVHECDKLRLNAILLHLSFIFIDIACLINDLAHKNYNQAPNFAPIEVNQAKRPPAGTKPP